MLKIKQLLTSKLLLLFVAIYLIFSILGYILIQAKIPQEFFELWIELEIILLILFTLLFLVLKNINNKVSAEIQDMQDYLREISNKNYSAVLKINNIYEFLEISLILKNIVKRLHNKDKKKK